MCEGRMANQGLSELQSRLPDADLGDFDQNRQLRAVADLFIIGLLASYITLRLGKCTGAGTSGVR